MPRIQGVFQSRVGFNQYTFLLSRPLPSNDEEDELSPLTTTSTSPNQTIQVECTFEPFLSIVEYDLECVENTPPFPYQVSDIYGTKAMEWSETMYKILFPATTYRKEETLVDFLNRMKQEKIAHQYQTVQWIQWNKLCYLIDLFGTTHADRRIFKYIQDQRLLTTPLKEWLQSKAAIRCPYRIHPEVLRAYIRDDPEFVDEIAMIEEIKYAMGRYRVQTVTGKQLSRAYMFCKDVEGTLQRLVTKGVLKDQSQEDLALVIVSFMDWCGDDAVVELDPGQPLEPYIRTLTRWSVKSIPLDTPPTVYHSFDADPKTKKNRLFLEYSNGTVTRTFSDVKLMVEILKPTRVCFLFGYDASTRCVSLYDSYWFTPWKLMRTKQDGEYVCVQREDQRFKMYTKGQFKGKPVMTFGAALGLNEVCYLSQTVNMVEEGGLPESVLNWFDIVFFMSRDRTPRPWLDYLDRVVKHKLCVVGEMPRQHQHE